MRNRENNNWFSTTNLTTRKKRNNTKNQPPIKAGDNTINNNDISVFDFNEEHIEKEALKSASKFEAKKPTNKNSITNPYDFLQFFAKECETPQNGSKNAAIDIDDSDTALSCENKGREAISHKTLPCKNKGREAISCKTSSWVNNGREAISYKTSSWVNNGREALSFKTKELHNPVYDVDSDEDGRKEIRVSSATALADEKGSLEELPSRNGVSATDCEAVVVVSPKYIKFGNMYYTTLTFSSKYITLEKPILRRSRRNSRLEWSTFDIIKIVSQPCQSVGVDVVNIHLKTKDKNVVEVCDGNSGTMALEFAVLDDTRWSKNQEEIKSLNMKYGDTWETIVSGQSFVKQFDHIIYPEGDPDAISVSRADVELLQPRTFINDTLIDFYIKFLINKTNPEKQQRFHFFNTFFFRKLRETNRVLSSNLEEVNGFECVRKWTRNIDLFEKDYIFIPVNFSLHWSLIVICHPGKVATLRDKTLCILHMDFIKESHT